MKIVILAGQGTSTNLVYNELSKDYEISAIIIEDGVSKATLIKRRIKKLGFRKVLGQILFMVFLEPRLRKEAAERTQEILEQHRLDATNHYESSEKHIHVASVNSEECLKVLQELAPDLVIVNGTRIISQTILNGCSAKFINMHAGITPKYRGVHGAYWAFYEDDAENAGVTVHFVDPGIDTGGIIFQDRIEITDRDNFTTYPLLQTVKGIELEKHAIAMVERGEEKTITNDLPSVLRTHPTIWEYRRARKERNIR